MENYIERVALELPYIVKLRKYFHINAEVAGIENKTTKRIISELKKMKVDYEVINKNSVIAYINKDRKKKALALRTGIEGYEIRESDDNEYTSENDFISHATGNDCNIAAMLGVIKILKEDEKKLNGKAVFIFESNSPQVKSSDSILKAGCLPNIEYFYTLHLISQLKLGSYDITKGKLLVGLNSIKIKWYGNSIVTALNNNKTDLIRVSAHFAFDIVGTIANNVDNTKAYKVAVTEFKAGGYHNIIPDYCEMSMNIRYEDNDIKKEIHKQINESLKDMENRYSVKTKSVVTNDIEPLANDSEAADFAIEALKKINGKLNTEPMNVKMLSETLSNYAKHYKTSLIAVGSMSRNEDGSDFYTKDFFPNDEAVHNLSKLMMQLCLDYFN